MTIAMVLVSIFSVGYVEDVYLAKFFSLIGVGQYNGIMPISFMLSVKFHCYSHSDTCRALIWTELLKSTDSSLITLNYRAC